MAPRKGSPGTAPPTLTPELGALRTQCVSLMISWGWTDGAVTSLLPCVQVQCLIKDQGCSSVGID